MIGGSGTFSALLSGDECNTAHNDAPGQLMEVFMDDRKYLTAEEVSDRYRGSISVGTLRNWRAMRIGPAFIKIGKAVLYPVEALEAWDQKSIVACRASKRLAMDANDRA